MAILLSVFLGYWNTQEPHLYHVTRSHINLIRLYVACCHAPKYSRLFLWILESDWYGRWYTYIHCMLNWKYLQLNMNYQIGSCNYFFNYLFVQWKYKYLYHRLIVDSHIDILLHDYYITCFCLHFQGKSWVYSERYLCWGCNGCR